MTKPIHPRPSVIIEGQKPKRIRRTKAQMAEACQRAELDTLIAEARVLAEKRLAKATPGQKRAATRIVNRVLNGPKYRWS
jgi:hypothetical protein